MDPEPNIEIMNHELKNLPPARNSEVVIQQLENETLVYDLSINKAYCLNETSARVFLAAGNNGTFEDLRKRYKLSDELIYLALDELKKNNLIQDEYSSPFAGISRREVIRKVGLTSMVALPVISTLIAPTAAHAGSGGLQRGSACNTTSQCRSGDFCVVTNPAGPTSYCCYSTAANRRPPGFQLSGNTTSDSCTARQGDCCTNAVSFTLNPGSPTQGTCVCT